MKLSKTLAAAAAAMLLLGALSANSIAADKLPGVGVQPESYFYTGKPYDKDLEAYRFAERDYDAGVNRWTTPDPSGFPDGTNNHIYVQNCPTIKLDAFGLQVYTYRSTYGTIDHWSETYYPNFGISKQILIGFEWRASTPKVTTYNGEHQSSVMLPEGMHWITGELLDRTVDATSYGNYSPNSPIPLPYETRDVTHVIVEYWHAQFE